MLSTRGGGVAAATGYLRKYLMPPRGYYAMVTNVAARSQSPERAIQQQAMNIQCDPQFRILPSLGSSLFGCTKAEDLTTKTDLHQRETDI